MDYKIMEAPKYELAEETRQQITIILEDEEGIAWQELDISVVRPRALRDIPVHEVVAGSLGGFIQTSRNLSQQGECWIDETALAIEESRIKGDTLVMGDIIVKDTVIIDLKSDGIVDIFVDSPQVIGGSQIINNSTRKNEMNRYV